MEAATAATPVEERIPERALVLCSVWLLPAVLYWFIYHFTRWRRRVLQESAKAQQPQHTSVQVEQERRCSQNTRVLLSSLEHKLPDLQSCKAIAGGLGKVVDLISRHHPTDIICVHPMMQESGKLRYERHTLQEEKPISVSVEGQLETVRVFHFTTWPAGPKGPRADFLLLSHPRFEARADAGIYPNPMSRRHVMKFFSLWNQAVGKLLVRHRPDVYHCPDFHAAVAPWYALEAHPDLRVLLVLHNAEYQGTISTDMMEGDKLDKVAHIFNLPKDAAARHLVHEGRFNMLKAVVDFVLERQNGFGVCAVSDFYAGEVKKLYSLLWPLPAVRGLDNPMLEEERPALSKSLAETRADAKKEIQEKCGLNVDPDARLFVSLGRLVRQKGVDVLADIAPWLLTTFTNAQLIVVGPIGDGFGHYAALKLRKLMENEAFVGRVFIKCEFWAVPSSLKFAADFCLMPSRDEPFGYVDIEFAWHGGLLVGAQAGGLGKVPGFYYVAQNKENLVRLRLELRRVICRAMACSKEHLDSMSEAAMQSSFPLDEWQRRLMNLYEQILPNRDDAALPEFPVAQRAAGQCSAGADVPGASSPSVDVDEAEFLVQELSEKEIEERVKNKLDMNPNMEIKTILESIGKDVDMEREPASLHRWLLRTTLGVQRVHWLVCIGYLSTPVTAALVSAITTEWAIRADKVDGRRYLVTADAAGQAFGVIMWTLMCMKFPPRLQLSLILLLKLPLFLVIFPWYPSFDAALAVTILHGVLAAGSLLFIIFNFMMSLRADMSSIAVRMGVLEMLSRVISWVFSGWVTYVAPTAQIGTKGQPIPWSVSIDMLPLAIVVFILNLVPGLLLLAAPGPYRDDRLPSWDLPLFGQKRSFVFLSFSDCFGALYRFASETYIIWLVANGWDRTELVSLSMLISVILFVGTGAWYATLSYVSRHSLYLLLGVTVLLAPPVLLWVTAISEVSTHTFYGTSGYTVGIIVFSLFLEGVRTSSIWAAKILVLGSRWRLLSYTAIVLFFINGCAACSPWLAQFLVEMTYEGGFFATNQKEIADAVNAAVVPLALAQYVAQAFAALFIRKDVGMPSDAARGATSTVRRWIKRLTFPAVALICGAVYLASYSSASPELDWPETQPFYQCYMPKMPTCETVLEESGPLYGANHFGQETSAKAECIAKTRQLGGDTFVFQSNTSSGFCRVQRCGSSPAGDEEAQRAAAELYAKQGNPEIWSSHCAMHSRSLVMVQLFEWRWDDIALECEQFLGPTGINAVQVSPPQEHILGDAWYVRYKPVSYILHSRSGTQEEFVDMVRRCRKVGVSIMVDAVINHMADDFLQAPESLENERCGRADTLPCVGWNGTYFENRNFPNGRPGLDRFLYKDFHHYVANDKSNCGGGMSVTCDMEGLPDLDTEAPYVQTAIRSYLFMLWEMGVTMLRIDAAVQIYPESTARMVYRLPWDYIVLEIYQDQAGGTNYPKAQRIGSITDMSYGHMLFGLMADSYENDRWVDRSWAMEGLLSWTNKIQDCNMATCSSPNPPELALLFVVNHDQTRHGWAKKPGPPQCEWDGFQNWRCIYYYVGGLEYHMAQLFMLAWPYGYALRLMSHYEFSDFKRGPPGVAKDSLHDSPARVYKATGQGGWHPDGCREAPDTAPVTEEYRNDTTREWICEHKWAGVGGAVRFRELVGKRHRLHTRWSSRTGAIAYSLGDVGFVALRRGWNWYTGQGANATLDLAGLRTGMPNGTYCNLAAVLGPVAEPSAWTPSCTGEPVVIGDTGIIVNGTLPAWSMLTLHVNYSVGAAPPSLEGWTAPSMPGKYLRDEVLSPQPYVGGEGVRFWARASVDKILIFVGVCLSFALWAGCRLYRQMCANKRTPVTNRNSVTDTEPSPAENSEVADAKVQDKVCPTVQQKTDDATGSDRCPADKDPESSACIVSL